MFFFLFRLFCVFLLFCVLFPPMYIVVNFLFVYNFTDHSHRVQNQLQLIDIIYHIKCQCCGTGWILRVEISLVLDFKLMAAHSSGELVTLSIAVPNRIPTYVCVVI
jgi:hypothetical protein